MNVRPYKLELTIRGIPGWRPGGTEHASHWQGDRISKGMRECCESAIDPGSYSLQLVVNEFMLGLQQFVVMK